MALDPVTGEVEHRIACPGVRTDLTTMGGNLVQVVGEDRELRVIDPDTGEISASCPIRAGPRAVRTGGEPARGLVRLRGPGLMDLRDPEASG